MFQMLIRSTAVVLLLSCCSVLADDTAIDPHMVYEQKCASCHENHAGEFTFTNLERKNGVVTGAKSGIEVGAYLRRGHGGLDASEQEALANHLTTIVLSGQTYRKKCMSCHDQAIKLARKNLILQDGILMGRYSGREIEIFLENHGRLTQEEISPLVSTLTRLRSSVRN